jgi:DNA invertase Pin-like site-specific DNA recombinase
MARRSEDELKPKNGHSLWVLIVSRISGCDNQKEASLDDQEDNAEDTVRDLYDGPVDYRHISTKGKGERLDRPELEEIKAAYESGEDDLVVYDDLSRLIRGGEATRLLGVGVDNGAHSICIEDGIDIEDGTWEEDALNACSENVAHQERTSKRIKKKNMNRFRKYGRPTGQPIACYIVPEGATSCDDWLKDEKHAKTIREAKDLLVRTLDCSIVADFFNTQGFPVGRYVKGKRWNGRLVRHFFSPIPCSRECHGEERCTRSNTMGLGGANLSITEVLQIRISRSVVEGASAIIASEH